MDNQNQLNAEADVVKSTITNPIMNTKTTTSEFNPLLSYIPKAKPTIIKFSSRASVKIINNGDHYYTVEYGEERQIDNFEKVDINKERQLLIDDCNRQVDNQIEEIVKTFLK